MDNETQNILVLFAHPALHKSRVNVELIKIVQSVENVTFHDLYEKYPDFYVDVKAEQKLLVEHDIIVFMHPLYWYNVPALLKQWLDLVLEHGFAYGQDGNALNDKILLSVITTAGSYEAYQPQGRNRYLLSELLAPLNQTAHLCGMDYLPPFVIHDVLALEPHDIAEYGEELKNTLEALRDNKMDFNQTKRYPYLNSDLSAVIMKT
jgi:glutathione-regulated potassium-efflux system ancillary protein KefG